MTETPIDRTAMTRTHARSLQTVGLSVWRNFSSYLVGVALYYLTQWGLVIVLAKLGSPATVGQFTLALAIASPVFLLTNLELATVQTSDLSNERTFGDYLGLRLLCSLAGALIILSIAWFSESGREIMSIMIWVTCAKFVETLSELCYGHLQKHERLDVVARSLLIRGLVSLAVMTIIFAATGDLAAGVVGQLVVWSIVFLGHDLVMIRRIQSIRPRFQTGLMWSTFRTAFPLGAVAGVNGLAVQVPRYAVETFLGKHELGIFSAIASIAMMSSLITLAISRSTLPRLVKLYERMDMPAFKRLILRIMSSGAAIGVIGVVGALLFGNLLLTIVYSEAFAAQSQILVIAMINVGILATFSPVANGLLATKRFGIQIPIQLLKLLAVVLACLVLVPLFGTVGAAWATAISSVVSVSGYSLLLWRAMRRVGQNSAQGD